MDAGQAAQLLAQEYFAILTIVENDDDQSLIIKGWSVTVGIAALIAAYSQPMVEAAGRIGRWHCVGRKISAVANTRLLNNTWSGR